MHHLHLNKKQYFNDKVLNNDLTILEDSPVKTKNIDEILDDVYQKEKLETPTLTLPETKVDNFITLQNKKLQTTQDTSKPSKQILKLQKME